MLIGVELYHSWADVSNFFDYMDFWQKMDLFLKTHRLVKLNDHAILTANRMPAMRLYIQHTVNANSLVVDEDVVGAQVLAMSRNV